MCRLDRNRAGGGVALYVCNTIITKHRQDLSQPNIEMLWSDLAFKNYKVLIGVCCRPPNGTANDIELFITGLENVFNLIVGHSKIILVLLVILMIVVSLGLVTTVPVSWAISF